MELKNVLKVCDEALAMKDYEIRNLQKKVDELKAEIAELTKPKEEYGEG